MESKIHEFQSDKELIRTLFNNFGYVLVFIYYAEWNEQSKKFYQSFKQSVQVFGDYPNVKYFALAAERCPQTMKKFEVEYTPTVIFTQTDKKILKKYESQQNSIADISSIFEELERVAEQQKIQFEKDKAVWHPKIKSILQSCPVIVFIKGTPKNPKCGFTSTLLDILKQHNVQYAHYDIIEDELMRYWLREYKGWATYPQVFIHGKVIGGLDKVKEHVANGQFTKMLPQNSKKVEAEQKYHQILKDYPVVAFVQGFAFEDQEAAKVIQKASQKYGEEKVSIINLAMDDKLKSFVAQKIKAGSFVVENGKVVEI